MPLIFDTRTRETRDLRNRENHSRTECTLHVDFTENYPCVYGTEIQSHHFGGSCHNTSLHTGVHNNTTSFGSLLYGVI